MPSLRIAIALGVLLIPSVSYAGSVARQNAARAQHLSNTVVEVPASMVTVLSADQIKAAKAYARQQGIRWRIVRDK